MGGTWSEMGHIPGICGGAVIQELEMLPVKKGGGLVFKKCCLELKQQKKTIIQLISSGLAHIRGSRLHSK